MASRNLRNKSGNQPVSLPGRILRSASRDHSANNSLTEENLASLTNSSPKPKAVRTKTPCPSTSSKSTPNSKTKVNPEPVQQEKVPACNESYSSDDIDFSIVDPRYSSRKSVGTPKVTLRSTKPKVSQRKPAPTPRTQVLSDSDFDEQKVLSTSKITKIGKSSSSKNTSNVQFEPQSPKVMLHKLNFEGLHRKDESLNTKVLDSTSSSSSDSYDDDDESSSEDDSLSRDTDHPINLQMPIDKDKRLQISTDDTYCDDPNESSYNYEAYFLANTRIKFRNEDTPANPPAIPNDCRKGVARKPRKGKRGLGGANSATGNNIPVCPIDLNFSVSKEAAKAVSKLSQQSHQINTDDDSEDNDEDSSNQIKNDHSKEIQNFLTTSIESQFPRWILLMSEGFNIIVHGFGSKIPVFDSFKKFIGDERLIITVNGLYSKLNPRSLCLKFLVNFCDALDLDDPIKVSGTNLDLLADHVVSQLMEIDDHPDVFLLLMNFDHIATNYPLLLNVLCTLAKLDWIHILASCDHLNASLGLTHAQSSTFNFIWFPCSTFHPYRQELRWNPSVFGDQGSSTSEGTKRTLQYVLKSLTTNARKAFTILASMQLALSIPSSSSTSSTDDLGVDFSALLRRCRESFIAHSDAALKALLVEFIDHKLISHHGSNRSSKAIGNKLMITLDLEALKQVADDKL